MRKTLFSICCIAVMAIVANSFASPTLTLESKNTTDGNSIKLALTLSNSEGEVVAISTDISYDSNFFEYVSAEIGVAGSSAEKEIIVNDFGDKIRIGILSINNTKTIGDGIVGYLNLNVKSTATGTTSLINTSFGSDTNGNDIPITGNTAQISISGGQSTSYKILTDLSPSLTIYKDENVKVFGSNGVNTITVESGGEVQCVNFVGTNVLNIKDYKSDFTARRSGATVYLQNTDTGTIIKIPATKTKQQLCFDYDCYDFIISNGKVMIGMQEITTTKDQL